MKEFRGISSTLFEIKTNLKPFLGGLGKQPLWQEFPLVSNIPNSPGSRTFELASSEGLQTSVPWPWGRKGDACRGIRNI